MPKSGYIKCPYFKEIAAEGNKPDGKSQEPASDIEIARKSRFGMFLHNLCKTDCDGKLELYAGGVYRKYCFCPHLKIYPGLLINCRYEEIPLNIGKTY